MIVDLFFVAGEVCHSSALIREVQKWILGSQVIGIFNRSSLARFWESRHLNCLAELLSIVLEEEAWAWVRMLLSLLLLWLSLVVAADLFIVGTSSNEFQL